MPELITMTYKWTGTKRYHGRGHCAEAKAHLSRSYRGRSSGRPPFGSRGAGYGRRFTWSRSTKHSPLISIRWRPHGVHSADLAPARSRLVSMRGGMSATDALCRHVDHRQRFDVGADIDLVFGPADRRIEGRISDSIYDAICFPLSINCGGGPRR